MDTPTPTPESESEQEPKPEPKNKDILQRTMAEFSVSAVPDAAGPNQRTTMTNCYGVGYHDGAKAMYSAMFNAENVGSGILEIDAIIESVQAVAESIKAKGAAIRQEQAEPEPPEPDDSVRAWGI